MKEIFRISTSNGEVTWIYYEDDRLTVRVKQTEFGGVVSTGYKHVVAGGELLMLYRLVELQSRKKETPSATLDHRDVLGNC